MHSSLREGNGAGLRTAAFFFGHQVMHLIDIFVQPAIFMSLYYTLTLPEIKFVDYYISAPPHLSDLPEDLATSMNECLSFMLPECQQLHMASRNQHEIVDQQDAVCPAFWRNQ